MEICCGEEIYWGSWKEIYWGSRNYIYREVGLRHSGAVGRRYVGVMRYIGAVGIIFIGKRD